jgi:CRP-like cAMP-binding protein
MNDHLSSNGHSHNEAIDGENLTAGQRLAAIEARLAEERRSLIAEVNEEIAAHEASAKEHAAKAADLRKQIAGYAVRPAKRLSKRAKRTTDRAPASTVDGRSPADTVRQYFVHNDGGVSAGIIAESTGLDRVVVSRELKKLVASGELASEGKAKGTRYSQVTA